MELLGVCSTCAWFLIVVAVIAFSLQAACVWLNVPPVTFGQAVAMTILNTVLVNGWTIATVLAVRRYYFPQVVPLGATIAILLLTASGGTLFTGWLYTKFFDGVWFGKGVAIAVVANVIEFVLVGAMLGLLAILGFALD